MNILMMSKIFVHSGVASHIIDLSTELIKKGNNVWIASSNNEHADFCNQMHITFIRLSFSMRPFVMLAEIRQICRFIRENKIDIVHCHHRTCALLMRIVSGLTNVPFVWTNHANNIPHDLLHRVTSFCGKKAICVSTDLKDFCMQKLRIPEKKIAVVYNGINPNNYAFDAVYAENFKKEHGIETEKVLCLYARMDRIKNHVFLLDALGCLSASDLKKLRVVFYGGTEGEYVKSLKKAIMDKGLQNIVIFGGYVTPSQAMSVSDMSVIPSLSEGFSISSIESFAMKVPHIRTKTGGYRDMEDCCIGIELGDINGLAREIKRFIDGEDYTVMIEHAYHTVHTRFTSERMVESVLEIYREALNG